MFTSLQLIQLMHEAHRSDGDSVLQPHAPGTVMACRREARRAHFKFGRSQKSDCRLKSFYLQAGRHVIVSVARSTLRARVAARARAARAAAATPPPSRARVSALDCARAARPWPLPCSATRFTEYCTLARAARSGDTAPRQRRRCCATPPEHIFEFGLRSAPARSPNVVARRLRLSRFAVARP